MSKGPFELVIMLVKEEEKPFFGVIETLS